VPLGVDSLLNSPPCAHTKTFYSFSSLLLNNICSSDRYHEAFGVCSGGTHSVLALSHWCSQLYR
jgi:hypothetical protein